MAMKVTVKLLATYRKLLPPQCTGNVYEMELPEGIAPEVLLAQFNVPLQGASVVLVNGLSPAAEQTLKEDDVVCAFPAIAGG